MKIASLQLSYLEGCFLFTPCSWRHCAYYSSCASHGPRHGSTRPERVTPDQFITKMDTRLNLTEWQEMQVRPIIEEEFEKRKILFEKHRGKGRESRGTLFAELKELRKGTETRLEAILTGQQMKAYRELLDEQLQAAREKKGKSGMRRRF